MSDAIINKVSESLLTTIDLEAFYPKEEIMVFDMKNYLFMELILKEKEFREKLKTTDLTVYENKNVALICTADAIIPMWAYMLVASSLQPVAKNVVFGNENFVHTTLFLKNIFAIDVSVYTDKRVVIKGCGELPVPEAVYVAITELLRPVVKSIMYGEPCSTVPIYKKK